LTGKTGEVTVRVSDAALVSIRVAPLTSSVPSGLSQFFEATAVFTDQSTLDVTRDVLWVSSAPEVATISNAAGSQGKATAAAVGTASITATLQGKIGSATMEVTAAVLQHLEVAPDFLFAPKGVVRQFTAMGTFSDQSMRDVTEEVLWASSSEAVASISNAPGSRGAATALTEGETTITASQGPFRFAQATLRVTPAEMVAIVVNPGDPTMPPTRPVSGAG
jgi:hypothetical protein